MKKVLIIVTLTFTLGFVLGQTFQKNQLEKYQGKTIKEWAITANNYYDAMNWSQQQLLLKITPFQEAPTTVVPTNTQSYRQAFMNICGIDESYCTCMYNFIHLYYSDKEIQNEINTKGKNVFNSGYGSNGQESGMFINALSECNNRFNSK